MNKAKKPSLMVKKNKRITKTISEKAAKKTLPTWLYLADIVLCVGIKQEYRRWKQVLADNKRKIQRKKKSVKTLLKENNLIKNKILKENDYVEIDISIDSIYENRMFYIRECDLAKNIENLVKKLPNNIIKKSYFESMGTLSSNEYLSNDLVIKRIIDNQILKNNENKQFLKQKLRSNRNTLSALRREIKYLEKEISNITKLKNSIIQYCKENKVDRDEIIKIHEKFF